MRVCRITLVFFFLLSIGWGVLAQGAPPEQGRPSKIVFFVH
jgi:hypothetical protein